MSTLELLSREKPGDALRKHYGFEMGVLHRLEAQHLSNIDLAPELRAFLDGTLAACFLAVRLREFDKWMQLSVFLACEPGAPLRTRLRCRRKTSDLSYMRGAMLWDSRTLAEPLAHCTISFPLTRVGVLSIDFLEKTLSTCAKRLSLGKFMLGVTLSAVAPFLVEEGRRGAQGDAQGRVDPGCEVVLKAEDDGSGQLVRYYERLGFETKEGTPRKPIRDTSKEMRGKMSRILHGCVEGVATASETPVKQR